jgi:GNAT superfamily N-acetyltransferase
MRIIRPLEKADTKPGFTCGVQAIDDFLAKRAWQQHSKHLGTRVWVLADAASHQVLGLYSLSVKHIERERLHGALPSPAPPRPLGVFYVGYFGVALAQQGQGLGKELMRDALRRCIAGAEVFGVVGVFLDSLDDRSTRFYASLGFHAISLPAGVSAGGTQPMFIPMRTLLTTQGPTSAAGGRP